MQFLKPNQKIKKLRTQLNMKQQDLQDKNLTRGLISMIEIGKRNLQPDTAEKLVDKFNKRARELGYKLDVDANYLLRSPGQDAKLYCLKMLKKKEIDFDKLKILFNIADDFALTSIKAEIYSKYGDIYRTKHDYNNAFLNYNNALDIFKSIKQNDKIAYHYLLLGSCKANFLHYSDAIVYFSFAIHYSEAYKDLDTYKLALYDISLAYIKLNNIYLALDNINKYLSIPNIEENFKFFVYANMLKANCYKEKHDYDTAIDIHKSLISRIKNSEDPLMGYIYNNLGLNYSYINNFDESMRYFHMAEKLREKVDKQNLSYTFIEKSYVFIKQNLHNKAIESIESGLKIANHYKDKEALLKGYIILIKIYERENTFHKLEYAYLKSIEILKTTDNLAMLNLIYNKLSLLYLNKKEIANSKKYLLLSQNIIHKQVSTFFNDFKI